MQIYIGQEVRIDTCHGQPTVKTLFFLLSILVYTDQPLKQVLQKMEAAERMLKWAVELNMFNITFESRKAIKGRDLAGFIVELTWPTINPISDPTEGRKFWTLMVDGSSTTSGC